MDNKNISAIGIGKLGLPFALLLEKKGYNILGCDIDENYIKELNQKIFCSNESNVSKLLRETKYFTATKDLHKTITHSDIIFIFLATPSLENGRYDHTQVTGVVSQIIDFGRQQKKQKHLIICCTVMPGYTDDISNKLHDLGYTVSYNPEFIAQGSVMRDLVNPDILLIGEGSKSAGDKIEEIYLSILQKQPSIHRMSRKEAEITKIALNCFLTTKIAYANMVGDIAKSAGCSPDLILDAVGSDSRIGNKNLKYGYGYGGPCFPRDNRAFALFADDVNIDALISKASDSANKLHLQYQVEEFMKNNAPSKLVTFTGLAYKSGTTIIEESQKLALAVKLARKGYRIIIQEDQDVMEQIKLIYGDLFHYVY